MEQKPSIIEQLKAHLTENYYKFINKVEVPAGEGCPTCGFTNYEELDELDFRLLLAEIDEFSKQFPQ